MCGIILSTRKDKLPVGNDILTKYYVQRARGHEGFGFITIDKNKISGIHRFELESEMEKALRESTSSNILFHHRFPTSTPNYKEMSHPIEVKNDSLKSNYYIVHNGVMKNEDFLKEKHEKNGFEYTTNLKETLTITTNSSETVRETLSFNDSESFAIELALFLDGKQENIDTVGTVAFVCIETDKKDKVKYIHYGRNSGNPLISEEKENTFSLKSVGGGNSVVEDIIGTLDFKTKLHSFRKIEIGHTYKPYQTPAIGFGNPTLQNPYHNNKTYKEEQSYYENEDIHYIKDDDYLLDLWAEIEDISADMERCEIQLKLPVLSQEDFVYNTNYLFELTETLKSKKKESIDWEISLGIRTNYQLT